MSVRIALAAVPLLAAAVAAPLSAQDVRAWLEPETVAVGQTADLVVEVELGRVLAGVGEPGLPAIRNARVVGRSRESRVTMAGVSIVRTSIYRYTLLAQAPGVITIDPIRVTAGDRVLGTAPLRLLVVPGGREPPALEREPGKEGPPPVFAVARLDRARAWVGQQVTLTFSFYHDPSYPLAESPDYDPPETPGFWRMEIDKEPQVSLERLGGRTYHVQRFRYALFPLRAGALTVGSASVRIAEPDAERWWEPGPTRTITTDPLRVRVDSLPPAPPGFAGAVGSYALRGTARPRATAAGTPIELELTVEGMGNPNAVGAPALPDWPDIEVRPPTVEARVDAAADGVRGEKTFRFLLVPESEGRRSLGAARLAYFDPATGTYRADTLRLGEVMVAPAPAGEVRGAADAAPGPTLWAAREPRSPRGDARGWAGDPWAWVGLAAPWAAWLFAVGGRAAARGRGRVAGQASPRALRQAALRLEREGASALADAERALDAALRARFGPAVVAGAPRERERALAGAGAPVELVRAVAEAGSAIAAARFAGGGRGPVATEEASRALGRVASLLVPARRKAGSRALVAAVPLLVLAVAGGPRAFGQDHGATALAPTPAAARSAWKAANDAYRAGDFAAAARLYGLLLETWPDPRLEADLAAALWRDGRPGAAYAHYLQALALDPHEGGVRRDAAALRRALGDPPDARGPLARGLGRVTTRDLFLLAAALDLALFAVFLAARRRRRARPCAAALASLLAVVVGAAGLRALHVERAAWAVVSERAPVAASTGRAGAAPIDWLPAGSVAEVLERGTEAWRVRVPGHPAGWVARAGIVPLDSRGPHPETS